MSNHPIIEHETTPNCWCKPILDNENTTDQVWIHNEIVPEDTSDK
jgi:hypothetical protein